MLIYVFGSGFTGEPGKFELASDLLRITFPYLFFIALVAFEFVNIGTGLVMFLNIERTTMVLGLTVLMFIFGIIFDIKF